MILLRNFLKPISLLAILHNIRSSHNVGSMFRTADAAGFQKIYLTGISPSPRDRFGTPDKKLAKVALGAENYVEWEKTRSISTLIKKLKKHKYKILAIEQSKKSIPYSRFKIRDGKVALIVGNEVTGLPSNVLRLADHILEIPMRGKKESLNVTVAFGIVGMHLAGQI